MIPETATDKSILTYDEYHNLIEKFNNEHEEVDGLKPNELIGDAEFNTPDRLKFKPYLEKLLEHIRNRGIFLYNEDKACSYISYILSNDIHTKFYEYKPETFKMFQEFVHKYNSRPGYRADICSKTLVYVISDIYKKMNNLYRLYVRYKDLKDNHHLGEPSSCLPVSSFLHLYNDFIEQNQPTNKDYKKILDNFEQIIKERVAYYKLYACQNKPFRMAEIKLPEDEKPKVSVQVQQKKNLAEYQESPEKSSPPRANPHTSHAVSHTPHEHPQTSYERPQPAHEHPQTPHEESHQPPEKLAPSSQDDVQQEAHGFTHKETHQRQFPIDLYPEYSPRNGPLESPRASTYSEHNRYLAVPPLGNEVDGAPSSMMSTITSALKDVDPVPVVGVSEEADVDNVSLLDSMEDTQDFSKVLKDLKKGIIQIIKLI
ncbi:hypothetical protein PVBG_05459 [Plasmodium vivax Brazil I]|uniref:Uncharacterized protein n=1 Tax=Plasmodium vivax (strain Brazil I) TaxID=1033975 RepID=A0A0J9SSL4_PLAV1|nr:hypothetical protein PVBG_05459 [Plasmodium vivax Brazil I]